VTVPGDTKDWTWVLERPCPECGVAATDVSREDVPARLRAAADGFARVLGRSDVRQRPRPDVWSPLEYACHVGDVLDLYDERLRRMLDEDDPLYDNWDQDATAVERRYGEQDPATVAPALRASGERLADRFAALPDAQWQRPGRRSDGATFTVLSFAQYLLHDVEHHLWDVRETSG
jgi:hypothetical protein